MGNSPLVDFTKISPNKSSPRNQPIDTITIHCVAGNASVETLGEIFAAASRQASSNYGVASDGRIGMYCEEKDRSWCTSSAANDNRAVTIEVSNDGGAPDWHVSDLAMASLIKLVADICKRNDIKQLLWKGDKSLIGQIDKQNMTVHRWFAAKSCPGDYLYNKHGYIAEEVNKLLYIGSIEETIWNFLMGKGLNAFACAGVLGNLFAESALKSTNLQNPNEQSLGMTDEVYTQSVDDGSYADFVHDKAGYGLAQWTYWSRKQALLDFCKAAGASVGDLMAQLNFLWKEIESHSDMLLHLTIAESVREASDIVLFDFERPADQSEAVQLKRTEYAEGYYNKFAKTSQASGFTSYLVTVNAAALNIRKGPGTNYPVVKTLMNDKNVYTITEEVNGVGASLWCKLKSGIGWVSKDFVIVKK